MLTVNWYHVAELIGEKGTSPLISASHYLRLKSAAYDTDAYRQARAAMRNAVERDLRIVEGGLTAPFESDFGSIQQPI